MEQHFCQSCGMPLYSIDHHGTSKDGSRVEDYCQYCFQEGQFTSDCTMEEMIQLCARYLKEWNEDSDRVYTKDEAIAQMRVQFPLLKRWARKDETQNEYYRSIGRVLDYLSKHLDEHPSVDTLAGIARISSFHFHRVFKAVIGENVGEYGLRLRMEYVVSQLRVGGSTLELLAQRTGYNGVSALSKAFKKYYGMAPSVFKANPEMLALKQMPSFGFPRLTPEIRRLEPLSVVYAVVTSAESSPEKYAEAWAELEQFALENGLLGEQTETIGINYDKPGTGQRRFFACLTVQKPAIPNERFKAKTLEGGTYAVFTLKGSYEKLSDLYKAIYFQWLPKSDWRLRDGIAYERYLNNPLKVKKEEVLTEVLLPVDMSRMMLE
jgi:AraC family transcriptional regulator